MGGNLITLSEFLGGWGKVHTIDYTSPGALKDVNYMTRPDLVHKFVVVGWSRRSKQTYWANTVHGDIYWPLVASKSIWIDLERLEPFPILPMEVTAKTTQKIRKEPEANSPTSGKEFKEGETARIMEYYPSGPNVWGKLQQGGWVALLLSRQYPTSWSMETFPPP